MDTLLLLPGWPGLQWRLLLWMLFCAVAWWALWNCFFRPRVEWTWALVLLGLALGPLLPSLRDGWAYGPMDTNVLRLPWAEEADLQYRSKGGALNDVVLMLVPWQIAARRQLLNGRIPLFNPTPPPASRSWPPASRPRSARSLSCRCRSIRGDRRRCAPS